MATSKVSQSVNIFLATSTYQVYIHRKVRTQSWIASLENDGGGHEEARVRDETRARDGEDLTRCLLRDADAVLERIEK